MASEDASFHSPVVTPFKFSNRVLLKTILERDDGGLGLVNHRVVIGGWVKSSKEVRQSSPPPQLTEYLLEENKPNKDVTCVEILQSRIPFIRTIIEVFGGNVNAPRKKVESGVPKPSPPQPSTVYLLVTDGSSVATLQVVVEASIAPPSKLMPTGTCILVVGVLRQPSAEGKHAVELKADKVLHIGTVEIDKYPLSKKRVPLDMLRDYSQFRPRTTTVSTVMRIRSALSFATHSFFKDNAFFDVQVPTITTTDSDGFSKIFHVTTMDQKVDKEKLDTIYETEGVSLEAVKEAAKEKNNLVENLKRTESNKEALFAAIQDLRKTNALASQLEAREKTRSGTVSKTDKVDSSEDFFSGETFLTVSGRLHLESYACALGNVYSFGPRFQADKIDSAKHAAEMWMVEVEMAFSHLKDSINCANELFKYLCKWILENCSEDIKFVAKRIDSTCMDRLVQMVTSSSEMVSYNQAIDTLRRVENNKFETNLEYGVALTTEHLSYLADHIYSKPVIIYNYPKEVKPFHVRLNDDGKLSHLIWLFQRYGERWGSVSVDCMGWIDVGTIISGSQSEERLNVISSRIKELGLPKEKYEWYLDLRRHGTVKHSGFTLRFDLMVLYVTGLVNVRDVIPFPRSYHRANN